MPTSQDVKDKAQVKPKREGKRDGAVRFLLIVLLASVAALLIIISLLLWPSVDPGVKTALFGLFTQNIYVLYILDFWLLVGVCVIAARLYLRHREGVELRDEMVESHDQTPAKAEVDQPAAPGDSPPAESPKPKEAVKCRLCGKPLLGRSDEWIAAVNHIYDHVSALKGIFATWQPEGEMQRIYDLFFEEAES